MTLINCNNLKMKLHVNTNKDFKTEYLIEI